MESKKKHAPVAIQPGAVKLSKFISLATRLGLHRTWVGEHKRKKKIVRKKEERKKVCGTHICCTPDGNCYSVISGAFSIILVAFPLL